MIRSSSVVSQTGALADRTLRRRIRMRRRLAMSAAAPANASAPTVAANSVGIISGRIGMDKLACGADGAATGAGSADDCVTSLAGEAVLAAAFGMAKAGGNVGQRVATAAVTFQTEGFAELASLPAALEGGLTVRVSSRTACCGRSSARASATDGFATGEGDG
jgi:hypothetical protein